MTEHQTDLLKYAYSLYKCEESAKDLCQDTMLAVHLAVQKGIFTDREPRQTKSYLMTTMYHLFASQFRKTKKRNTKTYNHADKERKMENSYSTVVENNCWRIFDQDEANKALSTLSPKYSVPLEMRSRGYKYQDIAKELGIPEGTAKTRIHHARKKLGKNK